MEDLQTELRELNQTLNKELIDLVNDNYQDFLSLGSTLSGGEERIEEIRLGLLGFQRDIKAVRDKVDARRNEVLELLKEKKAIRQETGLGRALLEIAERLELLEEKFNVSKKRPTDVVKADGPENNGGHWSDEWMENTTDDMDDEYDSDPDEVAGITPRLRRRTDEFLIIKELLGKHSLHHPFILAQDGRIRKIQEIVLFDLDMAIKQEPEVRNKQQLMQLRAAVED